ncbi:MAG: hypothetical protein Q9196_001644 [Gyalolechia fulgens]
MSQRPPLAIVGYAYRAPGVGRKGLWDFLEQGKSAWSSIPPDRFNHDAYYHPDPEKSGFISSQGAHFLPDDIYAFDPSFFKISADEARSMDPQHRLLLECAFEAAENAGLPLPDLLGSNTGAFAAGVDSDYNISMAKDMPTSSKYVAVGVAQSMFANRLSHFFGLTGPSITVDAACASSAYALHLACQNILAGECSTAFVGASKLLNGPFQWMGLDLMGSVDDKPTHFPAYDVNHRLIGSLVPFPQRGGVSHTTAGRRGLEKARGLLVSSSRHCRTLLLAVIRSEPSFATRPAATRDAPKVSRCRPEMVKRSFCLDCTSILDWNPTKLHSSR